MCTCRESVCIQVRVSRPGLLSLSLGCSLCSHGLFIRREPSPPPLFTGADLSFTTCEEIHRSISAAHIRERERLCTGESHKDKDTSSSITVSDTTSSHPSDNDNNNKVKSKERKHSSCGLVWIHMLLCLQTLRDLRK